MKLKRTFLNYQWFKKKSIWERHVRAEGLPQDKSLAGPYRPLMTQASFVAASFPQLPFSASWVGRISSQTHLCSGWTGSPDLPCKPLGAQDALQVHCMKTGDRRNGQWRLLFGAQLEEGCFSSGTRRREWGLLLWGCCSLLLPSGRYGEEDNNDFLHWMSTRWDKKFQNARD